MLHRILSVAVIVDSGPACDQFSSLLSLADDPVLHLLAQELTYTGNILYLESLAGAGSSFNFITAMSGTSTSASGTVQVLRVTGDGTVSSLVVVAAMPVDFES